MKNLLSFTLIMSLGAFGVACGDDDGGGSDTTDQDTVGQDTVGQDTIGQDTSGDTGGGDDAMYCLEECTLDGDCTVGGNDIGFTCDNGRCMPAPTPGCSADSECVAQAQGFSLADSDGDFVPDAPCTAETPAAGETCGDGDVCCNLGSVCLDSGYCATPEPESGGCTAPFVAIAATDIDSAAVSVCGFDGADDAVCTEEEVCFNPCASNDDCASAVFPTCNTDSGACECDVAANSCSGNEAGGTVCLDSGTCGCNDSTECAGDSSDMCYDGVCGCSGDEVCPESGAFDGTSVSCSTF